MALLRQRTSLPKSLPTAKKLPLLFCRTSLLALSAVAMPPQLCKEHGTTADSYTNAENHLQIICIRSVVQAVADAVLAVCKERKLTDAKLYTSHWA